MTIPTISLRCKGFFFGKLVVNKLAKQFLHVWKQKVLFVINRDKPGACSEPHKNGEMIMMTAVAASTVCFPSTKAVNTRFLDVC